MNAVDLRPFLPPAAIARLTAVEKHLDQLYARARQLTEREAR